MRQCLNAEDVLWETTLAGNEFHWDDILQPLVNSGVDDRSKATDSTSPQTFIVEDQ